MSLGILVWFCCVFFMLLWVSLCSVSLSLFSLLFTKGKVCDSGHGWLFSSTADKTHLQPVCLRCSYLNTEFAKQQSFGNFFKQHISRCWKNLDLNKPRWLYLLVIPSDMMSVILQQEETILILSLSTTSTFTTLTHRKRNQEVLILISSVILFL